MSNLTYTSAKGGGGVRCSREKAWSIFLEYANKAHNSSWTRTTEEDKLDNVGTVVDEAKARLYIWTMSGYNPLHVCACK